MVSRNDDVFRYLGRRGQDAPRELNAMADECFFMLRSSVKPRHVKQEFNILYENDGVIVEGAGLMLPGRDIFRHLRGCVKILLFAATLGVYADTMIRRFEMTDITKALVLDACASCMIEEICDSISRDALSAAKAGGLAITERYSPGYGDLPIEIQPKLLAALDAERRIGLTCSESNIMLPRKSVTAIIGYCQNPPEKVEGCNKGCNGCDVCSLNKTCAYRR